MVVANEWFLVLRFSPAITNDFLFHPRLGMEGKGNHDQPDIT